MLQNFLSIELICLYTNHYENENPVCTYDSRTEFSEHKTLFAFRPNKPRNVILIKTVKEKILTFGHNESDESRIEDPKSIEECQKA